MSALFFKVISIFYRRRETEGVKCAGEQNGEKG